MFDIVMLTNKIHLTHSADILHVIKYYKLTFI